MRMQDFDVNQVTAGSRILKACYGASNKIFCTYIYAQNMHSVL